MGFYDNWMRNKRRPGNRLTGPEMVAAKGILNLLVTESFKSTVGQLNVANEYYYGTPEPKDYDEMFELLCAGLETLKKNGHT